MIYAIRTKTRREFAAVNAIRDTGLAAYVRAETLRRRLGDMDRIKDFAEARRAS